MPKGILEFNLPEDNSDFRLAQNAWKYKSVLEDFSNKLRSLCKHSNTKPKSWEEVRELFHEAVNENDCALHSED
jgi:hypothetical protein